MDQNLRVNHKRPLVIDSKLIQMSVNNELEFVTYNQVQDTWMYVDKSNEYNKTFHILKYFDEEDALVIRNWSWLYRKSKRESFDEAINEDIFVENICSQTKK